MEWIIGWAGISIGVLLQRNGWVVSQFTRVLVTSVDSSTEMHDFLPAQRIVERHRECTFLGQGLVVPGHLISMIDEEYNLFHGFDEVWCFDALPRTSKPDALTIVAPLDLGKEDPPAILIPWMEESGCKLAMGDGDGSNYVTSDRVVADVLKGAAEQAMA